MRNTKPQWLLEFEKATTGFAFLKIKGFFDYQKDLLKLKNPDYCKDAVGKDYDADYIQLEDPAVRWVLDWCRRHCTRLKANLPADGAYLTESMHVRGAYLTQAGRGLHTLITRGFLIPWNEKDSFLT